MKKIFACLFALTLFLGASNEKDEEVKFEIPPQERNIEILNYAEKVVPSEEEQEIIADRAKAWSESSFATYALPDDNSQIYDWQKSTGPSYIYLSSKLVENDEMREYIGGRYEGSSGKVYGMLSDFSISVVETDVLSSYSLKYIGIDVTKKDLDNNSQLFFDYIPSLAGCKIFYNAPVGGGPQVTYEEGIDQVYKYGETYIVEGKAFVYEENQTIEKSTYLFLNKEASGNFVVMWGYIDL